MNVPEPHSPVPLTAAQSPLATTALVFASGLTPFAIACKGHVEAFKNMRLMKKAKISKDGTMMSLQDAELITSADVKFPSTACFAGEKLCGWLVVIDIFHGVAHDVSNCVRNFVIAVVPHLHSVQHNLPSRPALAWTLCAVCSAKLRRNASTG